MKKLTILILIIVLTINLKAQNLIRNGSFEDYLNIPSQSGEIQKAKYWNDAGGSPDYFHKLATIPSEVNIPYTFVGNLTKADEGLACVGICNYMEGWTNFREYLCQKLKDSLIVGKYYTVTIKVLSYISSPLYGGLVSDNFSILFSKTKPHKNSNGFIDWIPQYTYPSQLYANDWKEIKNTFCADSAYKFITIGCFVNDSIQQRHIVDSAYYFNCVYVFIDNISLIETSITGIAPINNNNNNKFLMNYDLLGREINLKK